MSEDEERVLDEGALYLVEDRVHTFKESRWPFDSGSCTPLKMAEAGFYYCGNARSPDWVRCVVCHQDMEGWEENDNPRVEHERCQSSCAFLKIKEPYNITFGDILDLEKSALENYCRQEGDKLPEDLKDLISEMREKLVAAAQTKQS